MLPSTGYFKGINCPFYDSGLCERPYCHFRHVRKEQQNLSNEGIGHGAIFHQLVSEAVKKVLQHTDTSNGQQAVHFVESEAKAADESDSNKPAQKVTYNPTPISQLEKITSADAESDSPEHKRRHIPVPYTPRKPASLPRPVETNGDSKPFIYIPPPVQYLPGTNDGALADPYMPKGGTESKEKYVPGTETEQQEYKPVESKTAGKVNYVPSDKSVKKKRILEYKPKPTKVSSKIDAPVVTYQPTPRSQVPCFSSDEEEPDAKKKRKLSSDLNSLDELGAEFDIIGQILDEEKSKDELRKSTDDTKENKESKHSKDSSDIKADTSDKKPASSDKKVDISYKKADSSDKKDKKHKSDKHEKTKSDDKGKDKRSRDKHDKSKSSDRKNSHKSTIKDREQERKKDKNRHKDKNISEKKIDHSGSKSSSEKKFKSSESCKSSEKLSKHSSRSKSKSHEKKDRHSEHKSTHKSSKEKSRSKDNKDKRKEKTEKSYNISDAEIDNIPNFNEEIEEISESDEEAIALQCKKIFEEYVPMEKPNNIEEMPKEELNSEEYIPTKKRISRTIEKNIKVVPKAPMKPDFKRSAAEKMAERLTKIREFHASRNSSSDSTAAVTAIQPSPQHSTVTPAPTATPSKIRIAHVPYASFMLNAKKTIPSVSLTAKSEPSTSTAIQTVKKGTQRLAHMPNEKFIDRPGVLEPLASKIPANVRSTYLNMMIDECLKIYLTTSDAYARAQHEELATSKKCTAIQIYKNSAVLAVSRLRKEVQECNGIKKSGSDCTTLQKIPAAISGTSNNANAGSWSIENKNKKNSPNINELKGPKFYDNISKWILSEEQLQDNGFPRAHPSGDKGRAMIYSQNRKNPPKGIFRPCSRCGKEYTVDKKGFPTFKEECIYHPNRKYRYRGEVKYQCCSQDGMSDGCCVAPSHVYEYIDFDNLKGYVRTMAPERAMDDYGVYSLDCEMCYTTQGLDLTRITVIDSACKVVYETLIKPLHPIIDYNTRYSGITEEHMADVRTTLLDVQATLLSMFNNKTILIGHSLESDFKALKIIHDTVIDTSVLFPHKMGPPYKRALRNLSSEYLKKIIQNSVEGHDSAEDATVCMELLHYKLKEDLKTRLALERKAELYEHLADGTGTSQLANRFLVDFGTKKQQEKKNREPSPEAEPHGTTAELDDDEEWAEFTDCLGRTRKCLKADLELYQKQDKNLARVLTKEKEKEEQIVVEETPPPGDAAEKPLLVQKTNDYLASLREKWEQKERELTAKDSDIHYQDLLFDEARIHGVGYYSFSTEEEERRKQMEDLQARRQETLRAQEEAAEKRRQREALVASRVAAAKAARRVRAGLPPEDPEEAKQDFTKCLLEFLTQQKNEADDRAKEEERRKREEQEKERQKLREAYVREWDVGKDGVESTKKFREMTQEEYVEQQRAKRIEEFAPPQAGHSRRSVGTFDNKGRVVDGELSKPKTWSDVRPRLQTPPPPDIGPMTENKGLYFSTAQRETKKTDFKYKNFVKPQEPESIVNELSDDEGDVSNDKPIPGKRKADEGTEIAPPPTYDYYGPTPKHFKSKKPFESDIREAYAQGAKSLETKESSRKIRNEYDFTFE